MDVSFEQPRIAWQPLTRRGVAAFAQASWRRLLIVQFVFAAMTAATVVWFCYQAWLPVIEQAIKHLPAQGEIRFRHLNSQGQTVTRLAENSFLALTVDLEHTGVARSPAHVQVEFGGTNVTLLSTLGFVRIDYPAGWRVAFNRPELEPWWGAWGPPLLAMGMASVTAGLMILWAILAAIYSVPVWLLAFFANRGLNLAGAWRLSGAALMPGTVFLTATILLYTAGVLDVLRFSVAVGVHWLLAWIYLFISPLSLPRISGISVSTTNPFAASVKSAPHAEPTGPSATRNSGQK